MSQGHYTYTVKIPHKNLRDTDTALMEFMRLHPTADVEVALDSIFAAGVRMALDGAAIEEVAI